MLSQKIDQFLNGWNYKTRRISDFRRVLDEFLDYQPDLVLMDVYLPFCNGHEWTAQIRKVSCVPILFLSSADDPANLLTALGQGADDYMYKPFELPILAAKIKALLRRSYDFVLSSNVLKKDGLEYDLDKSEVRYQSQSLILTKNEGRILKSLLEAKGKIVSRNALMEDLWNTDCYVDENTLNVNINRLRKKLESLGIKDWIATHKGQGYSL